MNATYRETMGPLDVQDVASDWGAMIAIRPAPEAAVTRDRYTDLVSRNADSGSSGIIISSFPIRWTPSAKEILKAGLTMPVDVIFYVSQQDMNDLGRTFEEIQESTGTVSYTDESGITQSFMIQQKARVSQWVSGYLYITIGARRA